MADYSEAYKKYFKDRLGMSIDELDKIFSSTAKVASPETQAVNSVASARSKTMLEMLDAMTPEARKATINKPYVVGNIEKAMAASDKFNRNLLPSNIIKDATMELSTLEKFARPVGSGLAGAIEAIPPMSKYAEKNPTAGLAEIALSPEGSKGIARGVGAMAGLEAGATLGAMSPVLKGPAVLAGAVGGSMAGAKLGDLLTGIPAIDKAIRALYEEELRKREAKMVEDISNNTRTMQLLEPILDEQERPLAMIDPDTGREYNTGREYKKNPRMADAAPRNMKLRSGQ